jgi:prophage regulatory protein
MSVERFLRLPAVEDRVAMKRSQIYLLARDGLFPKPVKIGIRASAWLESEVAAWIQSKIRDGYGDQP